MAKSPKRIILQDHDIFYEWLQPDPADPEKQIINILVCDEDGNDREFRIPFNRDRARTFWSFAHKVSEAQRGNI